jgi:hypothetical protein
MPAKRHSNVFLILCFLPLPVAALACALAALLAETSPQWLIPIICCIPASIPVPFAFLYLVPAYCEVPNCTGRANPLWSKSSTHQRVLEYKCQSCGAIHRGRLSFTHGGDGGWIP